jgi:DNA-binding transcriptional regulator GbsR (MarR family)
MPDTIQLSPAQKKFIEEWRQMHNFWGVEEETAHAQAILFLVQEPIAVQDLAKHIGVSSQKMRAAINPLLELEMIEEVEVEGDRRKFVECELDIWEMIRRLFKKRIENEVLNPVKVVRDCLKLSKAGNDAGEISQFKEILEMYAMMEMAYHQIDMLSTHRIRQLVHMATTALQMLDARNKWWPGSH